MIDEDKTDNSNYQTCLDCGFPYAQPAGTCYICPECGTTTGCS